VHKTKWITMASLPVPMYPDFEKMCTSIYARKSFAVPDDILRAELSVCALGLGVCTINGQAVTDDVLTTPYTQYDKRVIYQIYDVTGLLKKGKNAIGIHVGNGFYNDNMNIWHDNMAPWKDNPKVAVKLMIRCQSGEEFCIQTDKTWKCAPGSSLYNHMRQGEWCDASLRKIGFDMPEYDDSDWEMACTAREPGGVLLTTDMPPIRIIRTLKLVNVQNDVYDFGENTSGWASITLTGRKGQEVRLQYLETLDEDSQRQVQGFCIREGRLLKHEDVFICSGREKEEFHPSFCYHGFRYVRVINQPEDFEIVAQVVHTDLEIIGSFSCSDEFLNKVHKASVRASLTNYHGIPTDCPTREQNGWTGDALCSCEQMLLNFDVYEAYNKWFDDFKDAQRPSGQIPGIIPTAGFGYNWGSGPAWDSALILMPWYIYVSTGKTGIMAKMWENMVLYMQYLERMSTDFIADFGLGDYLSPDKDFRCPFEVTSTAFFYYDCVVMGKIAGVIGKDSTQWEEKAKLVRNAWRKAYMEREDIHVYQTYYACGLYFGLFNDEENADMADKLLELIQKNGYKSTAGMLGMKWMFSTLTEAGYVDVLYKMIANPEKPSFAYWINNGATTLCEGWSMKNSQNHHLHSEIDHWLYRYVGGIRLTEEGLVIAPVYLDWLDEVKVTHREISVVRKGKKVTVTVPCRARVMIGSENREVEEGTYTFNF